MRHCLLEQKPEGGTVETKSNVLAVKSWPEVGLAALLGLYSVSTSLFIGPTQSRWPGILGLVLWATLALVGLVRHVPIWSLPALGIVLVLASVPFAFAGGWLWLVFLGAGLILRWRGVYIPTSGWVLPSLMLAFGMIDFATCRAVTGELNTVTCLRRSLATPAIALVPVAIGLLLARRFRLQAALSLVVAESIICTFLVEPNYAMAVYPLGRIVSLALTAPMLICPLWVLLARSQRCQRWGILLPWGAMLMIVVIVPGLLRSYSWNLWMRHTAWAIEFFLALVLTVLLYDRLQHRPGNIETESVSRDAANVSPISATAHNTA